MNTLQLTAESPDNLIAGFGANARIHIQSSATQGGAYSDVGFVTLVSGTRSYTYEHLAGVSSTWYKFRFEDATGANANDYIAPFQVGDETAGLLCSLYDVQQELGETTDANSNENILEKIRQVSVAIEGYVGQWLAPRPANPTSTMTLLFDVPWTSSIYLRRGLVLDRGNRRTGIRSFTDVSFATSEQPDTGGVYTSATAADILMRPYPSEDGPATRLELMRSSVALFYPGRNTVSITGSFGWAAVPYDIQGVAIRSVVRRFIGKGGGAAVAVGPQGTEILLPDMSGADRATLDRYLVPALA